MKYFVILVLAVLLGASLFGCGDDDSGGDSDSDSDFELPPQPMCVYNQAYQENYQVDSVSDILDNAEDCYVLIDPFESEEAREAITEMQSAGNVVGCYMSIGTCEDWRDDFEEMQQYCVEEQWGEWAGEYFVDMPVPGLMAIMETRIDNMADWGCDMIEYDNMDWAFDEDYHAEYGFEATPEDAIAYFQALCEYTHGQGMGCMAKNTREGAEDFDGGTFESFSDNLDWWEGKDLQGFLDEEQLGIIIHYDETDCQGIYDDYIGIYNDRLSFICEDPSVNGYVYFNE